MQHLGHQQNAKAGMPSATLEIDWKCHELLPSLFHGLSNLRVNLPRSYCNQPYRNETASRREGTVAPGQRQAMGD